MRDEDEEKLQQQEGSAFPVVFLEMQSAAGVLGVSRRPPGCLGVSLGWTEFKRSGGGALFQDLLAALEAS